MRQDFVFFADREEEKDLIAKAHELGAIVENENGKRLYFVIIKGDLETIAKITNLKPEQINEIIRADKYGLSRIKKA